VVAANHRGTRIYGIVGIYTDIPTLLSGKYPHSSISGGGFPLYLVGGRR
jgi:hypothetical protein